MTEADAEMQKVELVHITNTKDIEKELFFDAVPGTAPIINSVVPLHPNLKWSKWSQTKTVAMNTLSYINDRLHARIAIFIVRGGKLVKVIHVGNPVTAPEHRPYLKELNPNLEFPHAAKEIVLDKRMYRRNDIRVIGCLLRKWSANDDDFVAGKDSDYLQDFYGRFLIFVNKRYPLPDGFYIMSRTDQTLIRKDGMHPLIDLVGGLKPLDDRHLLRFYPLLNCNSHDDYADIPLPTFDDWIYVRSPGLQGVTLKWSDKKAVAVFRGSATGCGFTEETNMRMKVAALGRQHPDILNAGLVSYTDNPKIHKTERVGYIDSKKYNRYKVRPIPFNEQSKFKYLVHIDGNVAAYRLGLSLLLGSVILLQESGSQLWFQHMMKPWVHYVPVAADLSDLIERIEWCKSHNSECETIAAESLALGQKVMTREACEDYFAATLWALARLGKSSSRSRAKTRKIKRKTN